MQSERQTAKDFLSEIYKSRQLVTALAKECDRLQRDIVTLKARPPKEVHSKHIMDTSTLIAKMEKYAEKNISMKMELMNRLIRAGDVISMMDNKLYAAVLYRRYIMGEAWERISIEMGYSYYRVVHMHGEALIEFEKIYRILD